MRPNAVRLSFPGRLGSSVIEESPALPSVQPPTHTYVQLPEMLRVSLDDMVLQILLLDKGDPAEFLASAVNPPTELAVANSIKYLCELQVAWSWWRCCCFRCCCII